MRPWISLGMAFAALPCAGRACELALLLAVDVSGSIDAAEYRLQMDGLALALRDGIVVEALVEQRAAVALMQWTGAGRQFIGAPWTSITSSEQAEDFADQVTAMPRRWHQYSTAIGDALVAADHAFENGPECRRRVVDVSSDGISNEGTVIQEGRRALRARGVTVNALVIETDDSDLTGYFWENVITGSGAFVVTSNGFEEYSERIRQKLVREVAKQLAELRN
ncbi:DUF1194 domain-containing protein [Shimia marina]|uniref:von Willebrand factor type A domain protein n=1 Tax=Shimia marina TaxID=321267 RepID=A0A0P1EUG5_9RHOB|nr:DUF1194 domain-containing protein [Shimia marina]CUH54295.1 von Willebrand factor type A domain protein [Shimia marina]SFD99756.1 Ca-activated chloride channel family protein [Shimia marina]